MMKVLSFAALTLALAPAAADPTKTIVENAMNTPQLRSLVKVLTSPGYEDQLNALNSPGNFTVFAPNNDAFAKNTCSDPSNHDVFAEVLNYHLLGERVLSTDLQDLQFPATLMDNGMFVSVPKGQVLGISANKNAQGAVNVTVNFGVPGSAKYTATVLIADVQCSNGVVHVVDTVLCFPTYFDHYVYSGDDVGLTEFTEALIHAGLVDEVNTDINTNGMTVFAPNDAAMKAAQWTTLSNSTLRAVLSFHVVPTVHYSPELDCAKGGGSQCDYPLITLQQGQGITVQSFYPTPVMTVSKYEETDPTKFSNIVARNLLTANGVVHVIDKVLIPDPLP